MKKLPFAVSIPHGGTDIPEEFVANVKASAECMKEDVDHLTREICDIPEERLRHLLSFSTSRTFVDLNRPPDAFGVDHPDGVVKRLTHLKKPVFHEFPSEQTVSRVLQRLYTPYHQKLKAVTEDPTVRLTLDCHSMSPRALPASPDELGAERPAICLGHKGGKSASLETIMTLRDIMAQVYELPVNEIVIDKPFNGGYITGAYGSPETPFIQIEFSRGFYMGDQVGHPAPSLSDREKELWAGRFSDTLEMLAKSSIFR